MGNNGQEREKKKRRGKRVSGRMGGRTRKCDIAGLVGVDSQPGGFQRLPGTRVRPGDAGGVGSRGVPGACPGFSSSGSVLFPLAPLDLAHDRDGIFRTDK